MNQEEANEKILELMNKYDLLSEKEIKLFKELIFECDLKIQDKNDMTPLIYVLLNNNYQNLNLNKEQLDYLIKSSDLKIQNKDAFTPLIYALKYNKDQNLNLNKDQFEYLLKNSDLKQQNYNGWTPLLYALYYNKEQDLKLTIKQFKEMYNALNEEQKQTIFQNLIQVNDINNYQYQEEINILLYDFKFQPNKETINNFKENKHQDIIQMIEKRDVFFQLNQEVKLMDKKEKIATIKL